jgi:hypothetical protein
MNPGWMTWLDLHSTGPVPPPAPTLSSPTNGATGVLTTPNLQWNASTGATSYGAQVSTTDTFGTTVFNQSGIAATQVTVSPALSYSTLYYWRVNASNASGTSGWSTVWSFTTGPCVTPSAPILSLPTDTATGVSTTPSLQWNASSGATSYRAQVSTTSGFTNIVSDQSGITSTQVTVSPALSDNTTYYWRVNATNSCGTSGWSTVWHFTTGTTPPPTEKLVGIAPTGPFGGYAEANQFFVAPFTAEGSGSMTKFRIYCASSGNVKVAIYDSTGALLLNKVDTAQPVVSGVNTITFPATSITAGSIYQLAAVSDTLIGLDSGSYHLYKTQTFTGFTFPTTLPSDFKRYDSRVPIFAGYK